MKIATVRQMAAIDAAAEAQHRPDCDLIELAGSILAEEIEKELSPDSGRVVVYCGPGKNGADGFSCAARLTEAGSAVLCVTPGGVERQSERCRGFMEEFLGLEGRVFETVDLTDPVPALVVDAMFGTGLCRDLGDEYLDAVDQINASEVPVLAVDLPSGLEANSGHSLPRCVKAYKTITFTLLKAAHLLAHELCGEVSLRSIGIPDDIVEAEGPYVKSFDQAEAKKLLPKRPANSHKGNYGKTLLLCGGKGYSGAACLASRAAVRAGAGIVTAAVPNCVYPICAAASLEAITLPLEDTLDGGIALSALQDPRFKGALAGADAIGTGSGLLPVPAAKLALKYFLESGKKLVIDAGMLNFLGVGYKSDGSSYICMDGLPLHRGVVLTPHLGELSRVLMRTDLTKQNPVTLALEVAKMADAVLVLKGNRTVVAAPDGRVYINTTGNPGMARGGSGDVLAGTIASLAARMDAFEAAALGVYLHGAAGDLAANRVGENGMTPGMMADLLPEAAQMVSKGMND